jgi:hypothetical protein
LLIDTGCDLGPMLTFKSAKTHEEILLDEAKQCIKNIEDLDNLDFDEILKIASEAEDTLKKYQLIPEIQDEELQKDPEYLEIKNSLESTAIKCNMHQKECENTLKKIEDLEKKIQKQQKEVEKDEEIEKQLLNPCMAPEIPQPTLEEIDQEIQSKIEDTRSQPHFFPDMDDITPENFPTLYYIYEKVLNEEIPENTSPNN